MNDPLRLLPIEKWMDLERAFKSEWPQGVAGYYVLNTQRYWLRKGYPYDCKVYCPYGDVWNGFVAINVKKDFYEVIIQCPKEDTTKLEEALRLTKIVDWTKTVIVPFAPQKVIKCLRVLAQSKNIEIDFEPDFCFVLDKTHGLYDVRIPSEITYGFAKKEHIDLIDSSWPLRYPSSSWYFEQMIKMNSGYALYKNNDIIAWVFINECGALTHLYVIDDERNKGYAMLLMKLVSNHLLEDNRDVLVYCLQENTKSYNLIRKLGFKLVDEVNWMVLRKRPGS